MAIVCRKCNYQINEEEISVHFWGAVANSVHTAMEFINNIYSTFRKKIEDTPEVKHEKKLCAIANQLKIICPECFQYNGWITIADESEEVEKN
ncbi:MAG: hypothetical protein Q8Q60_00175 [Candidatus Chromulinivorax sp.]|nr:hypothetical protein [Candidatus Chromulinivorax sp.]